MAGGSQWASAYEPLASHYDYLARVAAGSHTDEFGRDVMPSAAACFPRLATDSAR